ncbi:MAG: DUF1549 and DUF1553 domain-containing protein [Planctomycetaceae bacterium]
MHGRRSFSLFVLLSLTVISAMISPARGADDTSAKSPEPQPVAGANAPADAAALTAKIDEYIAAAWQKNGVEPAPLADDAEFLRRTYLNLAGKIPPVFEVRKFLADPSPDKRQRLVDDLLESPAFIGHLTNVYRSTMLPEADSDFQLQGLVPGFEAWLRERLLANVGYDKLVRELLTAEIAGSMYGRQTMTANSGPIAFFRAKDVKPENLAAGTSRLFLGVRLECAQCHNHPFAKWKQEEFWSLAAFYAGLEGDRFGEIKDTNRHDLKIPETETAVEATFLGGQAPTWNSEKFSRRVLADWLTSAENPYFARAAANRVWAQLMGIGIVMPIDDFDESNPPSHPELLDEMAHRFAAAGFDVKFLIRAITATKVYQLTSRQTHASQENPRLFGCMSVKGLTSDQLFESLAQATGFYDNIDFNNPRLFFGDESPRTVIRQLFSNTDASPTEAQTTILQALALMNGRFVSNQTDPVGSFTLSAVADSPFLDTAGRIEALYLAALSRPPRDDERDRMVAYVESHTTATTDSDEKAIGKAIRALLPDPTTNTESPQASALGDVFWALLNSSEFLLNH